MKAPADDKPKLGRKVSEHYIELGERAMALLRPSPWEEPDVWAAANRNYPASAGIPGPRDPTLTSYMIPFERRVHAGAHKRVVAVTAAQSGKTDAILDCIGARLDQRPGPIIYVGPGRDFVVDIFEPRLMGLINEAPTLTNKVVRGRRMKKVLKYIAGVRVRLAYAGSSASLKSDPAALAFVDEFDEFAGNIRGQGDPLGLVEARGETYADFVVAVTSTPGQGVVEVDGPDPVNGLEFWKVSDPAQLSSPIWRLFQSGTRHHFAWPCPHCGEYFIPRFNDLRWPKGASPIEAKKAAYLQCPQGCAEPILDHHRQEMRLKGVMIAPGQTLKDAFAGNDPPNSTWSCWTSGLCSPFVPLGDRAEKYLTAYLSGDDNLIQTVRNANFGECFSPGTTGDLPDWKGVLKHVLPYRKREAPRGVLRVTAGVDVQKRSLIYVIRGWGSRGTSWLLDSGYLLGNTDELAVWDDLTQLITNPVGGMIIERCFIDSGFRPDKPEAGDEHMVYQWAHKLSWFVNATKGRDILGGRPYQVSKIEVGPDGKPSLYAIDLVHINTDFFKGLVHSRLKTPLDQPGAFFLPYEADEDYARQIVSEARILDMSGEHPRPRWVKLAKHNHFLDCFDPKTELLTRTGWVPVAEAEAGMQFATVNLATDEIEYQAPTAIIARPHAGEMVAINGRGIDVLVTPNHRMVTERKFKTGSRIKKAGDLDIWDKIKRTARWRGRAHKSVTLPSASSVRTTWHKVVTEPKRKIDAADWAEFLGWFVSEGHRRKKGQAERVFISQNAGAKRDRICALVDRMGFAYSISGHQIAVYSRQLYRALEECYVAGAARGAYRKCAPDWIKDAAPSLIARFVEAAVLGDGWQQGKSRTYATTSRRLADDMQELFIKLGNSANIKTTQPPRHKIQGRDGPAALQYHVSETRTRAASLRQADNSPIFGRVPYDGMVHCVSVPNGTLIARRNGKAFIVGNCEALAAAAGYVLNVQAIPEGIERQWDLPGGGRNAPAEAGGDTATLAAPPKMQSIRDRFATMSQRTPRR